MALSSSNGARQGEPARKKDTTDIVGTIRRAKMPPDYSIPCNGNKVTLLRGSTGTVFEVSDHYLGDLLQRQMGLPEEKRPRRKDLFALADFRRLLSEEGAEGFTSRQLEFLVALVEQFENPKRPEQPSVEVLTVRRSQLRAFYAFMRDEKAGRESPAELLETFFTPAFLNRVVAEVRAILGPYGLGDKAQEFVHSCARIHMRRILNNLAMEHSPRNFGKVLFRRILNPEARDYQISGPLASSGLLTADVPKRLRNELSGVPSGSSGIAMEKLDYIESTMGRSSSSIEGLQGGAPGSGKGGTKSY